MKRKPNKKPKVELVRMESIAPSVIRHPNVPSDLLERIRKLWERVKGYRPNWTLEQFEIDFMREQHPKKEVDLWEKMADAVELAAQELTLESDVVFPIVLKYTMAMIKPIDRAKNPTKEIVAICKRVGLVPTPMELQRR